jgi:multiple sugar transport system substrate-binding protein
MPNQNLPQPNIPGQSNNQVPVSSTPPTTDNSDTSTTTVFHQPTPGISSRENPAGRPPAKPTLTPDKSLSEPAPLGSSAVEDKSKNTNLPQDSQKLTMSQDLFKSGAVAKPPQPQFPSGTKLATEATTSPMNKPLADNLSSSSSDLESNQPASPPSSPTQAVSQSTPSASVSNTPPTEDPKQAKKIKKETGKKGKLSLPKPILILLGVLVLVLIGFLVFRIISGQDSSSTPTPTSSTENQINEPVQPKEVVNIIYWGLWEDGEILSSILSDFEAQEGIRVDYRKQSHRDYRERLEQALISGSGPDVFRYHITWTPMLREQLAAMPTSIMSNAEYQQTFYPVAYDSLQLEGRIVGIPLMYEGLVLFYNREMLQTANISVPTTWSELRSAANQLTVPSNVSTRRDNNITQGGLAIGNASNVEHFSDILALLILQNGGDPADPTSQNVEDALTFYTNFLKQDKIWSNDLPNSTVAFARGEVAMMFAPSWRALDVMAINPELDFATAPVPQLSSEEKITWASFWAEGVNKNSTKQEAAWKFLRYLSSQEVLRDFFNSASLIRPFGEIYPRTDMASDLSEDPILSAFVEDAPFAQYSPMASRTHDNGINDQIIQYYADAINAVLMGTQPAKALEDISIGVNQVIERY